MSQDLSPQNEAFIRDSLTHGFYPSRESLLDKAVEALRQLEANQALLERELQRGFDDAEAGRTELWDPAAMKRHHRERAAERGSS